MLTDVSLSDILYSADFGDSVHVGLTAAAVFLYDEALGLSRVPLAA